MAGLTTTEEVELLTEVELDARLYRERRSGVAERAAPDFVKLHVERRRPGMTLSLLHLEYLEEHPEGYKYTQFCERYREWLLCRGLSMRQVHCAGEKLFVDYSGKRPHFTDAASGAQVDCELFVTVLGASRPSSGSSSSVPRHGVWRSTSPSRPRSSSMRRPSPPIPICVTSTNTTSSLSRQAQRSTHDG